MKGVWKNPPFDLDWRRMPDRSEHCISNGQRCQKLFYQPQVDKTYAQCCFFEPQYITLNFKAGKPLRLEDCQVW